MTETRKQFRERVQPGDVVSFYNIYNFGYWKTGVVHSVPQERGIYYHCEIISTQLDRISIVKAFIGNMRRLHHTKHQQIL
jgi:hypothetical protein